jgi:hypothetical protein
MVLGAVLNSLQLRRVFGASLPVASIARTAIAAVAAVAVGRLAPLHDKGKLMTLVEAAVVGVTFIVVLVATRELGKRDLDAIKAVRRKRAANGGEP